MHPQLRACPVCSSERRDLIHRLFFLQVEQQVFSCRSCGMVYSCSPDVDYGDDSIYACPVTYGDRHGERQRYRELARRISHYVEPHARVLEVGCATGSLLEALGEVGLTNVEGIDLSHDAVELCKSKGLKVHNSGIGGLADASYDLIIASHVLEHVPDVHGFLTQVRQALDPHGMLYIEVPDAERYADFFFSPTQGFNLEHINHFTEYHLELACELAGLGLMRGGNADFDWSPSHRYPAIWKLFRLSQVHRYVRYLDEQMDCLRGTLSQVTQHKEIAVWGLGQMMQTIFSLSVMQDVRVVAATDSNFVFHGKQVLGVTVVKPCEFKPAMTVPILVCSQIRKEEIVKRIRELGLTNEVITL